MIRGTRIAVALLIAALGAIAALPAVADPPADDLIKDRATFIPSRKHQPVPGKVVGILLTDGQPVLSTEGRSGPPDQLCFAVNGCSYRWVYVPVPAPAQIQGLRVPVGDKGEFRTYATLDMARPRAVAGSGITAGYTLVEIEVNDGLGSPSNDSFVATKIMSVEGTKEYPLATAKVVADLKQRYKTFVQEQAKAIDTAMLESQKKALQDRKPTGPREQTDLMFLTWMPETKTLRAHFRTKVSDGEYTFVEGGARPGPFALPPAPVPPGGAVQAPLPGGAVAFPPPPPPRFKVKIGTTFGVEVGMAYEVSKEGNVLRSQMLPFESFNVQLPPPPGVRGRPIPLPVPPAPPVDR